MEQLLFTPLPPPRSRVRMFVAGWAMQAVMLATLLALNALFPKALPRARSYVVTNVVSYQPLVSEARQPMKPRMVAPKVAQLPVAEPTTVAKLVVPMPQRKRPTPEIQAPEVKIESKLPQLPTAAAPKVVVTNTFSTGSSAMPTTSKPAAAVQTGGFGDPNGVPARAGSGRVVNIATSGGFDMPSGTGRGNGRGGETAGVVASAGFGN